MRGNPELCPLYESQIRKLGVIPVALYYMGQFFYSDEMGHV